MDFYVNNEYVPIFPRGLEDPNASPERQYASKDGSTVEHNDIRLRLVDSDDTTYATFVLEKL